MILHTVNKSPFNNQSFAECLRLCATGSSVLFIEDGVYAAHDKTVFATLIGQHPTIKFYALEADVQARGLQEQLNSLVSVVNDHGFVKLVASHKAVQSWY